MDILCAVGARGGGELVRRVLEVVGPGHDLHLLHVINVGPRHTLEHLLHGPRHHPPHPPPPHLPRHPPPPPPPEHERRIDEAEEAAATAALEEARLEAERAGFHVHVYQERGHPEQIVISSAASLRCRLIAIHARKGGAGRPHLGPASIGHVARFVLDHAPCDVLLLRAT